MTSQRSGLLGLSKSIRSRDVTALHAAKIAIHTNITVTVRLAARLSSDHSLLDKTPTDGTANPRTIRESLGLLHIVPAVLPSRPGEFKSYSCQDFH